MQQSWTRRELLGLLDAAHGPDARAYPSTVTVKVEVSVSLLARLARGYWQEPDGGRFILSGVIYRGDDGYAEPVITRADQ